MTALIAAAASLVGVVVGVLLNHFFSARRTHVDAIREARNCAYSDFINAASRLVSTRRTGIVADDLSLLTALNDAKTRICLFGDISVIETLAEFWLNGGTLEHEQEILAFTRLCSRIRDSVGHPKNELYRLKISQLLFKLEPSVYSYRGERRLAAHDESDLVLEVLHTRSGASLLQPNQHSRWKTESGSDACCLIFTHHFTSRRSLRKA
jgi:hypothetical protein